MAEPERRDQPAFHIEPLSGAIGAELLGIDLAKGLDEVTVAAIRQALLEHLVIFFRDQDLTPERHVAFAKRFGETVDYPMLKPLEGHPDIVQVIKLEHERVNFGGLWHSDMAYTARPPLGTVLCARELPPRGGDTLFANMILAYESLSDGLRELLSGLRAVNSSGKAAVSATRADRLKTDARMSSEEVLEAVHPVVRRHPETGRKLLYVNPAHTIRFEGMSEAESAPLLHFLFAHQTKPEFTCRFRWRPGSVAFWDNRACQHNPVNDYHGYRRVMHRVTIAGDAPA